jgi:hypothetical protein
MTAFLVIAGLTVPVSQGNAVKRIERSGGNERTILGTLRYTGLYEKRAWSVLSGMMLDADAAAVEAAIANGAQVACSGNAIGGTVTCAVEQGDAAYVNTATVDGLGFVRTLALVLREA